MAEATDDEEVGVEILAGGDPIGSLDLDEAALSEVVVGSTGVRHAFASLRHRDFALFWSAGLVSNSGSWMQNITVPYVLYQLTHSTTWLGLSAFASFFPALLMGPLAGTIADRYSRRAVLLITQTILMLIAFSLWWFWVSGRATPDIILVHLLASGVTSGINISSWQSFVPLLVPADDMLNAVRLNSMQFTGARAFGPALGGLVLARFGPATAFMVNAVTFLRVIGALAAVRPRVTAPIGRGRHVMEQFREGIRYVRGRRALALAVTTITVTALCGSAVVQLAPAIARVEFHVGKAAYGLLVAMFGTGAVIGALIQSVYGDRVRRSRMTIAGLLGFSLGVILLGAAPTYPLGLLCLLGMGTSYLLVSVSLNTAIQARVAESYRGRVLSIYLMGLMAGVPVGALIEGRVAQVVGLRAAVIGAGVMQIVFAVVASMSGAGFGSLDEDVAVEVTSHSGVRVTSHAEDPVAGRVLSMEVAPLDGGDRGVDVRPDGGSLSDLSASEESQRWS
jgi:MFS family permease